MLTENCTRWPYWMARALLELVNGDKEEALLSIKKQGDIGNSVETIGAYRKTIFKIKMLIEPELSPKTLEDILVRGIFPSGL